MFAKALFFVAITWVAEGQMSYDMNEPACVPGVPGVPGIPGIPGIPGHALGKQLVVFHSQSSTIPTCPNGRDDSTVGYGYSLIETQSPSGEWYQVDLGSIDSCSPTLGPVSLKVCTAEGECYDPSSNQDGTKNTYLLTVSAAAEAAHTYSFTKSAIAKQVSRCAVCAISSPVITLHSQTQDIPACPTGWSSLWQGYSFSMLRGGSVRGGQPLASTGSCLKNFITYLGIDCDESMNCEIIPDEDISYWVSSATPSSKVSSNSQHVSRCTVCRINLTDQ